jgi:hypothetical protein
MTHKKGMLRIGQLAILIVCITYLAKGVDLGAVVDQFARYSPWRMLGVFAITLPTYALFGLRLSCLTGKAITAWRGALGCILAIAANNILPARLGELVKALYFKQKTKLTLPETMGVIFFERFLDVNVVAVATIGAAATLGLGFMGLPLLSAVVAGWATLFIVVRRLRTRGITLSFIPWPRVRSGARDILVSIEQAMRERPLMLPLGITVMIWGMNFCYIASIPLWLAELDLTWAQVLGLFVALYIGISIPGMPGGIGTAEGAVVAILSIYGFPKSEALALALIIRVLNFIPPTLIGLVIFLFSGLNTEMIDKTKRAAETRTKAM